MYQNAKLCIVDEFPDYTAMHRKLDFDSNVSSNTVSIFYDLNFDIWGVPTNASDFDS